MLSVTRLTDAPQAERLPPIYTEKCSLKRVFTEYGALVFGWPKSARLLNLAKEKLPARSVRKIGKKSLFACGLKE
jgi:hypothetical protein